MAALLHMLRLDAVGLQLIDHDLRPQIGQQDVGLAAADGARQSRSRARRLPGMRLRPFRGMPDHRLRRIVDLRRPFLEEYDEFLRRRVCRAGTADRCTQIAEAVARGGAWPIPFWRETAIVLPGG